MKIKLLNAKSVSKYLKILIDTYDEIHIAVAWGYNGPVADCLIGNKKKFASVTFGLAFCQTDPDLVDRLVGVRNAFVADGGNRTFHPKLYYFRKGDVAEAIIGSSNFTAGGLDKNWEASVHVKGRWDAPVFKQVRKSLEGYAELRKKVTKQLAKNYRQQFDDAKALRKPKNPILPGTGLKAKQLNSPLVKMSWKEYVKAVKASQYHDFDARLSLLRECQSMFAKVSSFADLSVSQRKAIAGVIGKKENNANLDGREWGWFGSMRGAGDFANRVAERDKNLALAIDCIPRHGEVTLAQYECFCKNFLEAFENSSRKGGVPTATRLLAMKRPDTFVCICKPNRAGISNALAFPRTTLNLDNYWERVIEPIRISSWYTASRPTKRNAELWDGRVAMLDAIYYFEKQT